MSDKTEELGKTLHDLAMDIAGDVNADYVPVPPKDPETSACRPVTLDDKIEAFKALLPLYIAELRISKKLAKDEPDGFNFAASRAKISAVEGKA